jgi:hypothetical protein
MEFILSHARLRPWKEAMLISGEACQQQKLQATSAMISSLSPEDARWLALTLNEQRHLLLAIEVMGKRFMASDYLQRKCLPVCRNRLLAWRGTLNKGVSEAIKTLSDFIFTNTSIIGSRQKFSSNIASMKAIEKAGFHLEESLRKPYTKTVNFFDQHV